MNAYALIPTSLPSSRAATGKLGLIAGLLLVGCPLGTLSAQHCRTSELQRFDGSPFFSLGKDVAVEGSRAAVATVTSSGQSAVDFYALSGDTWVLESQVASSLQGLVPLALSGDFAVGGVPYDGTIQQHQGAVVVFSRAGGSWAEVSVLRDPDAHGFDRFGWSVALDGDVLVVGAQNGDGSVVDSGTAVVFRHDGVDWVHEQTLSPTGLVAFDLFAYDVDLDGDLLVAGAKNFETNLGAAWVYRFDGLTWVEEQMLQSLALEDGDHFGEGVAVDGDVLAVGAPALDAPSGTAFDPGGCFVYRYDGATWTEEARLHASDLRGGAEFGEAVALSGGGLVVGSPASPGGTKAGHVYAYQDLGTGTWAEWMFLEASDSQNNDWLGASVAMDGPWIWAGAPASGHAAYVFEYTASIPGVTACNGAGTNPLCLGSLSGPKLGRSWTATIDTSGHPGAGLTALIAYDRASFGITTPYGELLVAPELLGGNFVFSTTAASVAGSATHTLAVPDDAGLNGFLAIAQGLILGGAGPELCNALDLIAGPP